MSLLTSFIITLDQSKSLACDKCRFAYALKSQTIQIEAFNDEKKRINPDELLENIIKKGIKVLHSLRRLSRFIKRNKQPSAYFL
jgi:hypothetical protein